MCSQKLIVTHDWKGNTLQNVMMAMPNKNSAYNQNNFRLLYKEAD